MKRRQLSGLNMTSINMTRFRAGGCLLTLVVVLVPLVVLPSFGAASIPISPGKDSFTSPFVAVGKAVRPAVVNIRIVRSTNSDGVGTGPLQEMYRRFFPDEQGKGGRFESPATGSGFVVSADGDILTNFHVVAGADAIFVRFSGETREYPASLLGSDPNTDLAVLHIETAGRNLPVVEFGDSDALEVGAWAIAIGNPFGNLESTLTVGVVSAKGRGDMQIGGSSPRYQDFIQTDAAINHGNSGGPLVNIAGQVIGVNTAISELGQGIGFAVPSRMAQQVYVQLKENGRVIRSYLGIVTEDVAEVAGARVIRVIPQTPAAVTGLQKDDVIVKFAGQAVSSRRQLLFQIAAATPEQAVSLVYTRDGRQQTAEVVPVEWQGTESGNKGSQLAHWLGMEVASLTAGDKRVARLKEALGVMAITGVMVVAVQEDQPAADAGIRPGDVLVALAGQEITDLEAYRQIKSEHSSRLDPLLVRLRTGGVENTVMVRPRPRGVEN